MLSLEDFGIIAGIVAVVVTLAKLVFNRYVTHDQACKEFVSWDEHKATLSALSVIQQSVARIEGYLMPKEGH